MSGEENTFALQLNDLDKRLLLVEDAVIQLQKGDQTLQQSIENMSAQLNTVVNFIQGTDKVFGFCRKHWRTAAKFAAGVVTAYGIGNPHVLAVVTYISKFLGV